MQKFLEQYGLWLFLGAALVLVVVGFALGGKIVGLVATISSMFAMKGVAEAVTRSEERRKTIQQAVAKQKEVIDEQTRQEIKKSLALPQTAAKAELLKLADDILEDSGT